MDGSQEISISDEALSTVALYSAVAGFCPLIPIPFVDDFVIARVHRRLCQKLCAQHDFYLANDGAKLLTSKPSNLLAGALLSLVLWPIKKLVRKLVYVLAIKSCADVAAVVFHEGWLLARAMEQGYVPVDKLAVGDKETLERLRAGIVEARDQVDTKPTTLVMQSAFGVGREVFGPVLKSLKHVVRSAPDGEAKLDAAEGEVAPIAARIKDEVTKHWSNGPVLDAALKGALAR